MSIKQKINTDLKKALLDGDKQTAVTLRGLKSVLLNAEIAAGKRDDGLPEEEVAALLQKEIKSRKESIELYEQGGSQDKAEQEKVEIAVIEGYLPEQMSDEELGELIDGVIAELGEVTIQQMGQVIGKVKQQAGSSADGARVAKLVKERINA